ncbi:YARHG domain-containing protein [Aquimarina algiphila]|uniref:YARHG domain-containing protein n=1 Tax=Aquimarina algiphila TaxID=2047982 RepID=UPI00232CFC58|nr:YARHG domain-containing protein [Aquimarina algiphila]
MQRKILVFSFLLIAFGLHAEPFFSIYPNRLNFENYPTITTTCVIRNEGSFRMTKANIDQFNFSLTENGLYIPEIAYKIIQIVDNDHVVVKLSYTSLSPLYINRDITFFLNAEDHFTFGGENYIFFNNGTIVNREMKPYFVHKHLTKQESNQNNIKPDPFLYSDKSLFECSLEELRLMRNEYYAQKGYVFKNEQFNNYFGSKKWYSPTATNLKQIAFTEEEKAEIAFIQYYEQIKSNPLFPAIDTIKYYDNDMIKEVLCTNQKTYNFWGSSKEKEQILLNSTYVYYAKEKRQPKRIGYFNLYHKQEQFREYHNNGIVNEELFIRKNGSDSYTAFQEKYHNTGKKRKESDFQHNISAFDIESRKQEESDWHIVWEYYTTSQHKDIDSTQTIRDIYSYATVYDFHTTQTPSEKEMSQIVTQSLTTNSDQEYFFDELVKLYEQEYPKSNGLELSTNNYIKDKDAAYIHSLDLYNTRESVLLCSQHQVSYVYISMSNKRYEQKLYDESPALIGADHAILYDDSSAEEIDKKYKVQYWNNEKKQLEFVDLFHPDMEYGTYILFMKITFPEHKKTFYSDKYTLEYIPSEEIN